MITLTLHAQGRPPLTARVLGVTALDETPILEVGGYPGVFFLTRTPNGTWQAARDGCAPLQGYATPDAEVERARAAFLARFTAQPQA